jgi:hypothetical protein
MVESDFALGLVLVDTAVSPHREQEKPTWWDTLKAFHHVGLLVNEPPGPAGLPFIESSDDFDPSSYRSRLPVRSSSISSLIVARGGKSK